MSKNIKKNNSSEISKSFLNDLDELEEIHNLVKNNKLDVKLSIKDSECASNLNKELECEQEQVLNKIDVQCNDVEESLIYNVITIKDLKCKELMHYKKLDNFFNNSTKEECQMMVDIINGNHLISLRFLDWFVTRYCYLYKLSINVDNSYIKQKDFNINISYKAQLKSFKKKYFDPFRRKKKFFYVCEKNNLVILTTLGQLNFFRWALSYDIIKYTEENYRNIITKLSHVNSYFKKHVIENNSFSTTDEKSDSKSKSIESTSTESKDLDSKSESKSSESKYKIKKDKKIKYKNPIVSRNIFLEL